MGAYVNGVYVPTVSETGWDDEVSDTLARLGEEYINVKQAPYGAAVDGTTNDAGAWQAAIADVAAGGVLVIPPGVSVYSSSTPLTIPPGVTIRGAGAGTSTLKLTGSAGLSFDNTWFVRLQSLTIQNTGTADICTFGTGGISQTVFDHVEFVQDATNKHILYGANTIVILCEWTHCKFDANSGMTVPPISFTSSSSFNRNTFEDIWLAGDSMTAAPFFFIDNTNTSGYNVDNTFARINAEQTNGGVIHLKSAFNTVIDEVTVYDLVGPTTADLFKVDKHTSAPSSKMTLFRSCGRRGGSLGGGLYDINLVAGGAAATTIESCHSIVFNGFKINAGSNTGLALINFDSYGSTVDNAPESMTVVDMNGPVRAGSYAHGNLPTASAVTQYGQVYCSTHSVPLWTDGSTWLEGGGSAHGSGGWVTYTPALTGVGWAVGNGTITGKYAQVGKTVHYRMSVTFGSTSTFGAGAPVLSLPVAKASNQLTSSVAMLQAAGGNYVVVPKAQVGDTIAIWSIGTAGLIAEMTSSSPTSVAAGDVITVAGTYEAS